ncbi:MAG: hypothetical protein AAGF23_02135 [Acidobacteriota bacterium]
MLTGPGALVFLMLWPAAYYALTAAALGELAVELARVRGRNPSS